MGDTHVHCTVQTRSPPIVQIPVDYKIWGEMQQWIYQTKIHDLDELKQRLIDVWHSLGQNIINDPIDEWRKRLRACIRAKEGHFEHLLWIRGTHVITLVC